MKIKAVAYKDDGKVETTLRFGDMALVVSAPVRVAIEGDTSGLDEETLNSLCRELEQGIARALDVRLFEVCVEIIQVAGWLHRGRVRARNEHDAPAREWRGV